MKATDNEGHRVSRQEGVVKYRVDYMEVAIDPAWIQSLNAWRRIVFLLGGIGRDPARYGGYGFGNISCRLPDASEAFIITGTQTGHLARLNADHYVVVRACDPTRNRLVAEGPIRPSSEALTHGMVYRSATKINAVIHVHSPEIWHRAKQLSLPSTGAQVAYGTPEMALETERLFRDTTVAQRGAFAMAGHEDGVVTFGASVAEAGLLFVEILAQALESG